MSPRCVCVSVRVKKKVIVTETTSENLEEQEVIPYCKRNKRKPFQEFLEYMKHAQDCQRKELKDPILDSYKVKLCKSELCNYVDLVITHQTLMSCKSSKSCNINACYSSFKNLLHCKECTASDCLICVPVKGKEKCNVRLREDPEDLDTKCGVYFEERSIASGTCKEMRAIEMQTDETKDTCLEACPNEEKVNQSKNETKKETAYLPGGLILERTKADEKEEKDDLKSAVPSKLQMRQITGFIQTLIGKTDVPTMLDQRLLYFYMFITIIEKEICDSSKSKEEYLKKLLEKINETNKEFQEYKKNQKYCFVLDAAHFYFKHKIIKMFGSGEVEEIIFPFDCFKIKLGKPNHKEERRWQKSLTPLDRDEAIFKMYSSDAEDNTFNDATLFLDPMISLIDSYCTFEQKLFKAANSKESYYSNLQARLTGDLEVREYKKYFEKAKEGDEKYLENYKNMIERFPENKINEISCQTEINTKDDLDGFSEPSVFCYSHFLVLIYSATYQLWMKSEKEKEVEKERKEKEEQVEAEKELEEGKQIEEKTDAEEEEVEEEKDLEIKL